MISKINKILIGMVTGLLLVLAFNVKVQAATANVSVSSSNGTKGQEVSVTVNISADELIGNSQIGISYDTKKLDYISDDANSGVAGLIIKSITEPIQVGQAKTLELKFRAKETGEASISVASNTRINKVNADNTTAEMTKNVSNGKITIKESSNKSNDNHLSGMVVTAVTKTGESSNVTLTPAFSPDVYEYKVDLASNVDKLVVATTLSDANATAKVSGTRIDPGNNKTTITVTAQDKTTATYTIYSTKTTEADSIAGDNPQSQETTTADFDRSPKKIKSIGKYIIQDFSLITIPEGFTESSTTYNGETVAALKGLYKPLTLLCLADDAQGTNIGIFIYNETSGEFNKLVNINATQKIYTIIPTDSSYAGPEGYTATVLDLNGDIVPAWIKTADSQFYIVYAMNWNGEASLYCFDTKELTMQRFMDGNKSENIGDVPNEDNKEYQALKKQYNDTQKEYKNDHEKKNKIIVALAILLLCAIVIIGFFAYKFREHFFNKTSIGDEENDENVNDLDESANSDDKKQKNNKSTIDEQQEQTAVENAQDEKKELNLDFVAQVNEVKPEKLAKDVQKVMEMDENEKNDQEQKEKKENPGNNINSKEKKSNEMNHVEENDDVNNREVKKIDEDEQEHLINLEDDEPFEIEFVDLEDSDQKKK